MRRITFGVGKRARWLVVLALFVIAGVMLAPWAVHAYRVREAKAWCEELARQIREKYGPAGPPAQGPEGHLFDISEFERAMPEPPALIRWPGGSCRRSGDHWVIGFGWFVEPNGSEGWSYDPLDDEWKKTGYIGPG